MPNFILYSHRGNVGSKTKNENLVDNSKEAVEIAFSRNYIHGVEIDVRRCRDGTLVITHDESLKHQTPHKIESAIISNLSYEELGKVEIYDVRWYYKTLRYRAFLLPQTKQIRSVFKEKMSAKSIIPKLEDIYNYDTQKEFLTELKENTTECACDLSKTINEYKMKKNIRVHGYDETLVLQIREKTGVECGILVKHDHLKRLTKKYIESAPFDFYSILWCIASSKTIQELVENGKGINFWTIDSLTHFKRIFNLCKRVERKTGKVLNNIGIITNIPDIIYEYAHKYINFHE